METTSSCEERSTTPPLTPQMTQELEVLHRTVSSNSSNIIKTNSNWALFRDDMILANFDPSKSSPNVEDWLRKTNECAQIYHWDEVSTIYLALGKLKGLARVWYEGLSINNFTWVQWQNLLRTTFPPRQNFAQLFYDASTYASQPGQNLNEYCFTKLSKLNLLKLNFTDEQIVDCIVSGINDNQLQLALKL